MDSFSHALQVFMPLLGQMVVWFIHKSILYPFRIEFQGLFLLWILWLRSAFGDRMRFIPTACHFDRRPKARVEKSGREGEAHFILRQMSRLRYAPLDMTERALEGFAKAEWILPLYSDRTQSYVPCGKKGVNSCYIDPTQSLLWMALKARLWTKDRDSEICFTLHDWFPSIHVEAENIG